MAEQWTVEWQKNQIFAQTLSYHFLRIDYLFAVCANGIRTYWFTRLLPIKLPETVRKLSIMLPSNT